MIRALKYGIRMHKLDPTDKALTADLSTDINGGIQVHSI